jgi:putative acetyltransferase
LDTYTFLRTNAKNKQFLELVKHLDASLAVTDGELHEFYNQFNGLEHIHHVLVFYNDNEAVACGALKKFSLKSVEIKRMFTLETHRCKGIGSLVLEHLEQWAKDLKYTSCVLETGKRQPAAIALYKKNGFIQIPNYGQYEGKENSVCFQKNL